jgi:hypothetical protein
LTSVLGLPLEQATKILTQEGVCVTCVEVRSRKGVPDGTQSRVIRQTNLDANHASLLYAVFRTKPNEANA